MQCSFGQNSNSWLQLTVGDPGAPGKPYQSVDLMLAPDLRFASNHIRYDWSGTAYRGLWEGISRKERRTIQTAKQVQDTLDVIIHLQKQGTSPEVLSMLVPGTCEGLFCIQGPAAACSAGCCPAAQGLGQGQACITRPHIQDQWAIIHIGTAVCVCIL